MGVTDYPIGQGRRFASRVDSMNYRLLDACGLKWVRRKNKQTLEAISSSYATRVRTASGEDLLLEILLILIASM